MFNIFLLFLLVIGVPIAVIVGLGWLLFMGIDYIFNPVQKYDGKKESVYFEEEEESDNINVCFEIKTVEEPVSDSYTKPFRPSNFSEYIGQKRIKGHLMECISSHKLRNINREKRGDLPRPFPHIIISGGAGTGKTLLGQIIASQLDCKFVECIGSEIESVEELQNKVKECDGGILFLDECHAIPRDMAESIYRIMEEFHNVKPFTLIGCTTELGEILKDRKPFYERFKTPVVLDPYTHTDIERIARQYKEKQYPEDNVNDNVYDIISKNAKGTPRQATNYIDNCVMLNGNIGKVLSFFNIIKDGYSAIDVKVLKYLNKTDKPIGLNGLVSYLGTSQANYEYQIEPYLIQTETIQRTGRGRIITDIGKEKLEELIKLS